MSIDVLAPPRVAECGLVEEIVERSEDAWVHGWRVWNLAPNGIGPICGREGTKPWTGRVEEAVCLPPGPHHDECPAFWVPNPPGKPFNWHNCGLQAFDYLDDLTRADVGVRDVWGLVRGWGRMVLWQSPPPWNQSGWKAQFCSVEHLIVPKALGSTAHRIAPGLGDPNVVEVTVPDDMVYVPDPNTPVGLRDLRRGLVAELALMAMEAAMEKLHPEGLSSLYREGRPGPPDDVWPGA